ncbi:MAG: putative mariner mos1 transposase [Streblomastix strix]|uniref:Putative mariner mos1 transposase n=1 Tax=Streblomastix strix TaxID=222440 RepID=A0A5J4X6E0_9EUKA|nr:MAG: putative mariner mos1 transposase [Streblomastix strix]
MVIDIIQIKQKVTIVKWRREFVINHSLVAFTDPPGRPKITGLGPQIEKDIIWDPYVSLSLDQPERPRQAIGDEKRMFTVFFSGAGIEYIHKLPKKKTMDSVVFVDEVLIPLQQKIVNSRHQAKGQIHLHFDNCRVYTSYHTSGFISNSIFTKMRHPPYSPVISPCDFFLFGILKSELKGKKFTNDAELEAEVARILMEIYPTEIQRAFRSWTRRCDYIIKHDECYYNQEKW